MKIFSAHCSNDDIHSYVLPDDQVWNVIVKDESSDYFCNYLNDVGGKDKAVDLAKMLNEKEALKNG